MCSSIVFNSNFARINILTQFTHHRVLQFEIHEQIIPSRRNECGGPEKGRFNKSVKVYLEPVYFVTAFVPSDTACFANSPGSKRRTAV